MLIIVGDNLIIIVIKMPICKNCQKKFPNKLMIDNKAHYLSGRKFCPNCSPIGTRNTRTYIIKKSDNEAFCPRCAQIKNITEFYTRKNGKPFSYCMDCQEEIKDLKFQENLERIAELKGVVCQDCGILYPIAIYDFYNNGEVYQISKIRNMSFGKIKELFRDYAMLCKNCCALRQWAKH